MSVSYTHLDVYKRQVYKGYNKDGIVHIQRADVFEQDWERAKNVLKLGDRLAAALGELM